jgi:hypothetical protein
LSELKRPIDSSILRTLALVPADEAAFRFEALKAALWPAGQDNEDAWLNENMEMAWGLRAELPSGRFARRCLIPYVRRCRRQGHSDEARRWVIRSFAIAPLSTAWGLLMADIRNTEA